MPNGKSKTKVVHLISSLNVGGAERFVLDLIEQQREQLANIEILSFGELTDTLVDVALQKGIKVNIISNASNIFGQLKLIYTLNRFDTIHLHSPRIIKTISVAIKLIGRKRLIYTRHGEADLSAKHWRKLHNDFHKFVDHMTFVSQESMDVFTQTYPWQDIAKEVVDNGVVIPAQVSKKEDAILKLGSVGRFVSLKNQICLLRAVALLPVSYQQRIHVHFFGDGECKDKLTAFSEQSLSDVNVKFHGMVQDRNFIYNAFDLLIVTSETEGLSLAIMEAMAFGLPVIATDVGGNSRLVKNVENGWLFSFNDEQLLASLVKNILDDISDYERFSVSARAYIAENFSIKTSAEKYLSIY